MNKKTLAISLGAVLLAAAPLAEVAAQPKPPADLTLAAQPNPVVSGRSLTLSGNLTGTNVAGRDVTLRADPFPFDKLAEAGHATTDAAGAYQLDHKPTVNTRYEARMGKEKSAIVTVLVRPAVTLRLGDYTPKVGQRVRFAGRVCPEHDGSRLSIQRRSAGGTYRTVARTILRDVAGSTCSSYRKLVRIRRDGRYRAVIGAHADHAAGKSRSRRADAHS